MRGWTVGPVRKLSCSLAVLLVVVPSLAACSSGPVESEAVSGSWSDIVAAAEREGTVTIYSSQVTDQLQNLALAFETKYPKIKLEFVRGGGDEGIPKVEAEHRTGRGIADLLVTASFPWVTANTDFFEAPRGPAFEADIYEPEENIPEDTFFVISAFVSAFGWNTELFSGTIDDWTDLLDPSLEDGKIGVISPDTPSRVDFYHYLEENNGSEFLEELAAQRPQIYPSALPMAAALTSGEIAAATFIEPLTDEKEAGAPVDWGLAKPSWGTRYYGVVLDSAPHPNAAQVLANFLVTEKGQQAIARNAASVLPRIPGTVISIRDVSEQDTAELSPEKVRQFQDEWDELFAH